jgi:hypothetical protein
MWLGVGEKIPLATGLVCKPLSNSYLQIFCVPRVIKTIPLATPVDDYLIDYLIRQ